MTKSDTAPVLVVDDEWIIRNQLTRALESVGIGCDHAVSGDDALFKFRSCDHQLVVTDLRMPHSNGHSLAVSLLAEPRPPAVVVLTGLMEPKLARDLLARGVRDVVFKPVNYFELADRLKHMLTTPELSGEAGPSVVANDALASSEEGADPSCERLAWTREKLETQLIQSPPRNLWLTMALRWFDWHEIPDPPAAPNEFLEQQTCLAPSKDRRSEDRTALPERAVAIPLDDHFEPVGEPFKLLVRDLSFHGIRVFHTEQPAGSHLALMWRTQEMERVVALARIVRCQPEGKFFDIGGVIVQ
jgi:CheY-like chemotaxis protein